MALKLLLLKTLRPLRPCAEFLCSQLSHAWLWNLSGQCVWESFSLEASRSINVQLWDLSGIRAVVQQKPPARLVMERRGQARKRKRGADSYVAQSTGPRAGGGEGGYSWAATALPVLLLRVFLWPMDPVRLRWAGLTSVHMKKGIEKTSVFKTLCICHPKEWLPHPLTSEHNGELPNSSTKLSCELLGPGLCSAHPGYSKLPVSLLASTSLQALLLWACHKHKHSKDTALVGSRALQTGSLVPAQWPGCRDGTRTAQWLDELFCFPAERAFATAGLMALRIFQIHELKRVFLSLIYAMRTLMAT